MRLDLFVSYLYYLLSGLLHGSTNENISTNISIWTKSKKSLFNIAGITQNLSFPDNCGCKGTTIF